MTKAEQRKDKYVNRKKARKQSKTKVADDKAWREGSGNQLPDVSEKFTSYYKAQGICPEGEWDDFIATLRRTLPLTFRISNIPGFQSKISDMLKNDHFGWQEKKISVDGKEVAPPSAMPWYPNSNGWYAGVGKKDMRTVPELLSFRQWLVEQTDQGNINRQEAVSMIPPLLLDVKSDHMVLDMCAAPGSKTAQLLEDLHEGTSFTKPPTGMVIANDADPKRAHMLVHQLKRLGSSSFLVTTHEGQFYPNLYLPASSSSASASSAAPAEEDAASSSASPSSSRPPSLKFDRILCDVPCSGDGTMRKSPNLWKTWDTHFGAGLHPLQLAIAERAARMLKVGGYMVYSTCSFNPIENEAVVAELLRNSKGSLELVDISDRLPGLIREQGLNSWKVIDKNKDHYTSPSQVPKSRREKVKVSFFPPTDEEAKTLNLDRCMRMLPHKQDTGGFFITLIRKVSASPATPNAQEVKQMLDARLLSLGAASDDLDYYAKPAPRQHEQRNQANQPNQPKSAPEAVQTESAEQAKAEAETPKSDEAKTEKPSGMTKGGKEQGKMHKEEKKKEKYSMDPFLPVSPDTLAEITSYYGLDPSFPSSHYFSRSDAGVIAKRIYYLSPAIAATLSEPSNDRLHVVHTGLRVFERNDSGREDVECRFRLVQEGVDAALPFITKQVVYPSLSSFIHLLRSGSTRIDTLQDQQLADAVNQTKIGCILAVLRSPETDNICPGRSLPLSLWRTSHSLNVQMNKAEVAALLKLLTPHDANTDKEQEKEAPSSSPDNE